MAAWPLSFGRWSTTWFSIQNHPLAGYSSISAREIVQHQLIGIDPNDPYGRIMSEIFQRQGLHYEMAIKAQRTVQVAGGLEPETFFYEEESGYLRFTLVEAETAETLRVRYEGIKPANFEDAVSIVAIGRYDREAEEFAAEKLLVKCPSKYQGLEEKSYS